MGVTHLMRFYRVIGVMFHLGDSGVPLFRSYGKKPPKLGLLGHIGPNSIFETSLRVKVVNTSKTLQKLLQTRPP